MIRFRTIDPAETEKASAPAPQPRPAPPAATPEQLVAKAAPEGTAQASAEDLVKAPAKGLTRKTPLRARKPEAPKLFES